MINRTKESEIDDLYTLFFILRSLSSNQFDAYTDHHYPLTHSAASIARVFCAVMAIQLKERALQEKHWEKVDLYNKSHQHWLSPDRPTHPTKHQKSEQFLKKLVIEPYEKKPFDKLKVNTMDNTDCEAFRAEWLKIKQTPPPLILSQEDIISNYSQDENEWKHRRLDNSLASFRQIAQNELGKYRQVGRRHWLGRLFDIDPANKKIADSLYQAIEAIAENKQQNVTQKFIAINALLYEKSSELQTKNSKRLLPIIEMIQKQLIQQVKNTGSKLTIQVVWEQNENLKMRYPKRKK